jgi:hypothetical protein
MKIVSFIAGVKKLLPDLSGKQLFHILVYKSAQTLPAEREGLHLAYILAAGALIGIDIHRARFKPDRHRVLCDRIRCHRRITAKVLIFFHCYPLYQPFLKN